MWRWWCTVILLVVHAIIYIYIHLIRLDSVCLSKMRNNNSGNRGIEFNISCFLFSTIFILFRFNEILCSHFGSVRRFQVRWSKFSKHFLTELPPNLLQNRLYEIKNKKLDPRSNCIMLRYDIRLKCMPKQENEKALRVACTENMCFIWLVMNVWQNKINQMSRYTHTIWPFHLRMPIYFTHTHTMCAFSEFLVFKFSDWQLWHTGMPNKEENLIVEFPYIGIVVLRRCNWTFIPIMCMHQHRNHSLSLSQSRSLSPSLSLIYSNLETEKRSARVQCLGFCAGCLFGCFVVHYIKYIFT